MSDARPHQGQFWRRRMSGRDRTEAHRASTPLELLFDLTFVIAVGRAASELAHSVVDNDLGTGVLGFVTVFFAIWWSWMNFTWFASAYDTDDVPYRLLTMIQMGGVLVLAAGVNDAFEHSDYATVTVGYVIMRVAMVSQWLRAWRSDPVHSTAAGRYVIGTLIVQLAWVVRLALPPALGLPSFVLLALGELLVPVWAERRRMTSWHPAHITERYGLFTIIVLGECVLAVSTAINSARAEHELTVDLVIVGAAGLVLLFGLWWLYFLRETAEALSRGSIFRWGYGYYGVFAGLAALGAGLEATVEAVTHHSASSNGAIALAVAVPISVVIALIGWLHAPLSEPRVPARPDVIAAVVATLAIALGLSRFSLTLAVAALTAPTTVLVAASVWRLHKTQHAVNEFGSAGSG